MIILGEYNNRDYELDSYRILRWTNEEATDLTAECKRIFDELGLKLPTHAYDNSLKGNGELIPFTKTIPDLIETATDEDLIGLNRPLNNIKVPNWEIILGVYCLITECHNPNWCFQRKI